MEIDQIREQLSIAISQNTKWADLLTDCEPGPYGVEDWDVSLSMEDIWVDIPRKTFVFKNAECSFDLLMLSSNHDDGVIMNFPKIASGRGVFKFINNNKVAIEDLEIKIELDLLD